MYSVSRLTLFAVLSAMEGDFRQVIFNHLGHLNLETLLPEEIKARVYERVTKEQDTDTSSNILSIREVCYYLDFGDLIQILNKHRKELPQSITAFIKENTTNFEYLIPIRNRVAHSRPLNIDDWPTAFDTAYLFLEKNRELFSELNDILVRIERDPSFVLGIRIPPSEERETIHHNLPIPDFDETGFYGRKNQVDRLLKLCLGPYPVITIVGEGGIGKTALALKAAYELLDRGDNPFDAIVWTSSKTTQLTPQEIVKIEGAIRDSLGMFQFVAQELGGTANEYSLDEVLHYLKEFKILLLIDNLETIMDERIKSFLEQLPEGSKVLITSRIGLGAFEFPLKLEKMEDEDASKLLRALAKIRGIESLYKLDSKLLRIYCNKMNNSPGYIKWFVSTIQTGRRPEEVFEQSGLFLDFCMSNVYKYLTEPAKLLLKTMFIVPGKHSQAELVYLTGQDVSELQKAIHETLRTNMVIVSSESFGASLETSYELSDLARQYLVKHHPVSSKDQEIIIKRNRQLIATQENISQEKNVDPFSFYNIQIRTKSDLIVAKYLFDALALAKRGIFDKAKSLLDEARSLSPEYYEVHRIDAIIKTQEGNISGARLAYDTVIDLAPTSIPVRKWFGDFKIKYLGDTEGALSEYRAAEKIDPNSGEIKLSIARTEMFLGNHEASEKILLKLIDEKNGSDRFLRRIFDISIECYCRWAEKLYESDAIGSYNKLDNACKIYDSCPKDLVDSLMIEKLKKTRAIGKSLLSDNKVSAIKDQLSSLISWIENECAAYVDVQRSRSSGTILSMFPAHGFIKTRVGSTFFFHKSDLEKGEWKNLWVGDEVSFVIGTDPRDEQNRPRAYNVTVKNNKYQD